MEAIRAARHDHALLRKKLALMESALQVAPEARFVLREMCFSLLRLLLDHTRREGALLERPTQPPSFDAGLALDHSGSQQLVRGVSELLLSGMRASTPTVVLRLSQAIEMLRGEMETQERALFSHVSASGLDVEAISGAMSVNEILQRYPQAEPVFTQLHVSRLREGYESLDEVAWRHGLDTSEVLEQLRQAAEFPRY